MCGMSYIYVVCPLKRIKTKNLTSQTFYVNLFSWKLCRIFINMHETETLKLLLHGFPVVQFNCYVSYSIFSCSRVPDHLEMETNKSFHFHSVPEQLIQMRYFGYETELFTESKLKMLFEHCYIPFTLSFRLQMYQMFWSYTDGWVLWWFAVLFRT